jgi:hypothetical protein
MFVNIVFPLAVEVGVAVVELQSPCAGYSRAWLRLARLAPETQVIENDMNQEVSAKGMLSWLSGNKYKVSALPDD